MDTENNVFILPSRAEEARNVARKLAEQHVSIAYCALPGMGLGAFAHEVFQVLRTDYSAVKVVRVRVRDSMVNTVWDLLQGLKDVGIDIDMSDLSRDSPVDFIYKALRNLPDGLQRLEEGQKIVLLWSDFDRLDSGSIDELNPDMFNFPRDFHLSVLLLSHLPIGSMWREGRCPDCLRNSNMIKPYGESELRDWCMGCGICGEDFETLWSECSGFPYVVDTVVSTWDDGNKDWVGIQKRIEVRSAEYAEALFSLFDKIKLRRGGTFGASLRACICSGAPLPSFAAVLLDAYGLKHESYDFLPRTLVEWIKKENENSAGSLQDNGDVSKSCVEFDMDRYKKDRDEILRLVEAGAISSIFIRGEMGCGKTYFINEIFKRLKKSKGQEVALVKISPADLPLGLAEDRLFGHVRGGHSTAEDDQVGFLEAANGGILFIDEIAKLSVDIQSKLLCVITDKELRRLGDGGDVKPRPADFLFVCASWEDPGALSREIPPRFSPDLLARLKMMGRMLVMPNMKLNRRIVDAGQLDKVLADCDSNRKWQIRFDPAAKNLFLNFIHDSEVQFDETDDLPGNWRQIRTLCNRMVEKTVLASKTNQDGGAVAESVVRDVLKEEYSLSDDQVSRFADKSRDAILAVLKHEMNWSESPDRTSEMVSLIRVVLDMLSKGENLSRDELAERWATVTGIGCMGDSAARQRMVRLIEKCGQFGCGVENFVKWISENKIELGAKRYE